MMNIGWIDFSEKDRRKALDVIDLCRTKGAVDELGIGTLRDAFANYFFPGTSTIQTRAKYFFLIPYAMMAVEDRTGPDSKPDELFRRLDDYEKKTAINLLDKYGPGEDGIFGSTILPRKWVERKPSSVYWNGLRVLGFFTEDYTIDEYFRQVIWQKRIQRQKSLSLKKAMDRESDGDDSDAGDFSYLQLWDTELVELYRSCKDSWLNDASLALTEKEAEYFKERVMTKASNTMLSYLLGKDFSGLVASLNGSTVPDKFGYFSGKAIGMVDDANRRMLELATAFSKFVHLLRVRYNYCLSDGKNNEAVEEWGRLSGDRVRISSLPLDEIFLRLRVKDTHQMSFLKEAQTILLTDPFDPTSLDKRLEKREVFLKGESRAKLVQRNMSEDDWVGGRFLDYRLSITLRLVRDVLEPEVDHV